MHMHMKIVQKKGGREGGREGGKEEGPGAYPSAGRGRSQKALRYLAGRRKTSSATGTEQRGGGIDGGSDHGAVV